MNGPSALWNPLPGGNGWKAVQLQSSPDWPVAIGGNRCVGMTSDRKLLGPEVRFEDMMPQGVNECTQPDVISVKPVSR